MKTGQKHGTEMGTEEKTLFFIVGVILYSLIVMLSWFI